MIYLPHPTFNFEEALGGHIIGCVNNYEYFKQIVYVDHRFQYEKWHLLNPDKIYSKFEKALTKGVTGVLFESESRYYWADWPITFSFLREDGAEFSIRFLNNKNIDVIGYWIVDDEEPGTRYPRSYFDFLEWLGGAVTG
jgi:hypothetical protein